MKAKNSLKNREENSIKALACPVDHHGVIKLQYLNMKTYESYSMWWNGGSLKNTRTYDHSIADVHESSILQQPSQILKHGNVWLCIKSIELIWHGL